MIRDLPLQPLKPQLEKLRLFYAQKFHKNPQDEKFIPIERSETSGSPAPATIEKV